MTKDKGIGSADRENADDNLNLKATRESLGLTLQDIFLQTRISVTNLEAIETLDFRSLPPPVYTRTFIKTYSKVVGLDEKGLLSRYERYIEIQKAPELAREKEAEKRHASFTVKQYRLLLAVLLVMVVLSVIVYTGLSHKSDEDISHNPIDVPATPKQQSPVAAVTAPAAPPISESITGAGTAVNTGKPEPLLRQASSTREEKMGPKPEDKQHAAAVTTRLPQASPASSPYHLSIEAREVTWLQIKADQDPPYQVLLR
ncbi:MAG: helix-turn-helix domain-containing protein, partial [Syntrophales bacterium LBB04]|nr:helix-turn-helix domain-containing protein [Syntrophales bacterium LBB04]